MTAIFRNFLSRKTLAECERNAALLSPELADRLYFVNLPVSHPPAPNTMALAIHGRFNYEVFEAIQTAGMWKGPRAAVVFCKRLRRDVLLGTLIHELGHLLPYAPAPELVQPTEEQRAAWEGFVAARLSRNHVGESRALPAWFEDHGLPFVRRCLHLHHRAWANGVEVGLPDIGFCGHRYDLSAPWQYMHALDDEPKRMVDCDFAEIERERAPAEFYQLFAHDVSDWCSRMLVASK